ncbi:hypothetical protein Q8A73_012325 [Channa argus]|nr:hypothetical protein Q8A73_012325 [Channa argus]
METGQLELTVEHNGCCEGLEVAVLSPDYCRHELNWMHKKKRRGGLETKQQCGYTLVQACHTGHISRPVSESIGFLNGLQKIVLEAQAAPNKVPWGCGRPKKPLATARVFAVLLWSFVPASWV